MSYEERARSFDLLREIYAGEPVDYQDRDDFTICKEQLIKLLEYIEQLDPEKLSIFTRYKNNASFKLVPDFSPVEIDAALKSTKRLLEEHILIIVENHERVDNHDLSKYQVGMCLTGAFANLFFALANFSGNQLSNVILSIKHELLLQIALQFLREETTEEIFPGDEVHFADALINIIADDFSLPRIEDAFLPQRVYEENDMLFRTYIDTHLTLTAFMETWLTKIEAPPSIVKGKAEFEKLNDFFLLLTNRAAIHQEYSKLYSMNEVMVESGDYEVALIQRDNFDIYYRCFIAKCLEEAGYLSDVCIAAEGFNLIDNGETIIKEMDNNFELLSSQEIVNLLSDDKYILSDEVYCCLAKQLDKQCLFDLYPLAVRKEFCFDVLMDSFPLQRKKLLSLYQDVKNDETKILRIIEHTFHNGVDFPQDKLHQHWDLVSEEQIIDYLRYSIINKHLAHLTFFLEESISVLKTLILEGLQIMQFVAYQDAHNLIGNYSPL